MSDTAFRSKVVEPAASTENIKPATSQGITESKIEVPALDYQKEHGKPHTVEYFGLSDTWNDPQGGFPEEVGVVEEYFKGLIESGRLANSTKAIQGRLKEIEKAIGTKNEERVVMRMAKVSAYIKFLMETDKTESNLRKYSGY
jgi:hypothetical protein